MKQLSTLFALAVLFVFGTTSVFAGVARYATARDVTAGNYVEITGTAITLESGDLDDGISTAIPIGFTFVYDGVAYTTLKLTTNGYAVLGSQGTDHTYSNAIEGTIHKPVIAPLWDDWELPALSNLTWESSGVVFTAQWKNITRFGGGSGPQNFQFKLFSDGRIEFIYGTMTAGAHTYSLGINDPIGGTAHFLSLQTAGTNTFSSTVANNALVTVQVLDERYTFTPPTPISSDITVTGTGAYPNVKAAMDTLRNYGVSASINIFVGASLITEPAAVNDWDFIPGTHPSSGNYTVTLRLAGGLSSAVVEGTVAGDLIRFRGLRNFVIDGDDPTTGGIQRALTIRNTNIDAAGRTIVYIEGTQSTTIKNCVLSANASGGAAATFGVIAILTANISTETTTRGVYGNNDNNIIENNDITQGATNRPTNCILMSGTTTAGLRNTGNIIRSNTIRNYGGSTATRGIRIEAHDSLTVIEKNKIFTITTTIADVRGIILNATSVFGTRIIGNEIYDQISTGPNPTIQGIGLVSATVTAPTPRVLVANNFIYINSPAALGTGTVDGINQAVGGVDLVYNSIRIGGTVTSGTGTTAGYRRTTAGTVVARNNIFYNTATNSGATATHWGFASGGNTGLTSNFNDIFADGSGGVLGTSDGTTTGNRTTLAAWQTATGQDANSVSQNPNFLSPTNLHIDPAIATELESGGQNIAGITDDYDGDIRQGNPGYPGSGTAPDIGADEFEGIPLDLSPPVITYTPLLNTSSTSNRSFTGVTVTDASGVNITAGTRPRVYYKRSTDANTFNDNTSGTDGWKFAEATGSGGSPFDFTIDYSLLNGGTGVTVGNIVQYFVVAQDLAPTPNVGINSGTFNSPPSSVALVAGNFPITGTINSYNIATAFTGSFNVGTGETYPTLTNTGGFFAAINAGVVTGNITANITSDLVEDGTNALNQWIEEGGSGFTMTIQPSAGVERLISATFAGGMIRLNGADRVTFDGRFSGAGQFLRFRNTSTTGQTFIFLNDATNNTIRDCFVEGANTSTTSGTIVFSTTTGTTGNDNNTISNNEIRDRSDAAGVPRNAVYSSGTAGATNSSNTISGNHIYNWTASGVLLASTGLGDSWTISSNRFYQTASRTSALTAISVGAGNGHTIIGNSVGGAAADRSGSPMSTNTGGVIGITLAVGTTSPTTVSANTIANINNSSTSWPNFQGIVTTSGNATISHNTIGGAGSEWDTVRANSDSYGIRNTGTGAVTISGNTVGNVRMTSTLGHWNNGINAASGTNTITGNTIRDLITSSSTSTLIELTCNGINIWTTTAGNTIEGNTIYNLTNTSTTASAPVSGIFVANVTSSPTATTISRNLIHSLTATGTGTGTSSPRIWGIYRANGSATYVNNMIAVGSTSGNDVRVWGIQSAGPGSNNWYFNSVAVTGSPTGTNKTYAFQRSSTAADELRNNILDNERSGGGGSHFAIGNVSATGWTPTTSNYNDLYSADSATVGEWLGTAGSFTEWQTNSNGDANSKSFPPDYLNTANDLHLNVSGVNIDYIGIPLSGFGTDFDGDTRHAEFPYIGADERTDFPLPITLSVFTARLNPEGPGVLLEWRTESEINNFGFWVERRREDEPNFIEVPNSFVPGQGTTTEPHDYSFVDNTLTQTGLYYYRLRQQDLDGTIHYSWVISIDVTVLAVMERAPIEFRVHQNYPNPFNPSTTIKFSVEKVERATVIVYNVLGQEVARLFDDVAQPGYYYKVELNGAALGSGVYFYRVATPSRSEVKKMLLVK